MLDTDIRIGFMPLYLRLYDTMAPGEYSVFQDYIDRVMRQIESCGVTLVSPGVVFQPSHVAEAEALFKREQVSAIVTLHLSYSPSLLVADFLQQTGLPILLVDTTPDFFPEQQPGDFLKRNHGIHGVMDLVSVLTSRGVDFALVSGHLEDGSFPHKLKEAIVALKASGMYRNQTIGITGKPFEGMGDFAVDFGELQRRFGVRVVEVSMDRLVQACGEVAESVIADRIAKDRQDWDVTGIQEEEHREAVRAYAALKGIIDEEGMSGYTMNFQHIDDRIPAPFYACSALISEGYGYGGEGDVSTACLGRPLNTLSPAAKFDEFFCPDWKRNRIIMSHMGEWDSRFAKRGTTASLVTREGFMNPHRSVIYRFRAEPGEVTFVNCSPVSDGRFRFVAGLLDIIDTPLLAQIVAPHYQVHVRGDLGEFLRKYAYAGGGHHLYVAKGNILAALRTFCRLLGFDMEVVTPSPETV